MKRIFVLSFSFFYLIPLVISLIVVPSCKKDMQPVPVVVKADTIFFVIEGVVVSNGKIISLGYNSVKIQGQFKNLQATSFKIIDYGYVVSSSTNKPTLEDHDAISHEGERKNKGSFESEISELVENTTYYARIYITREILATGNIETGYHDFSISFKTKPGSVPLVYNIDVSDKTSTTFQINSIINDENLLTISKHGHVWSKTNAMPDLNNNEGMTDFGSLQSIFTHQFSSDIVNLTSNSKYFVRAYATNKFGTGYSPVVSVITLKEILTDIDGNEYEVIKVGNNYWMSENLRVKKYKNGDLIATTSPHNKNINGEITPKYQWAYEGDDNNIQKYGLLYTWYAVADDRGVCPTGWHVPSLPEWQGLFDDLGGESVAGGKMKSISGWNLPNNGATNESGFNALPGGLRFSGGDYKWEGEISYWNTATEISSSDYWFCTVGALEMDVRTNPSSSKAGAMAVRCIKD